MYTERKQSKFQLYCSCIACKVEISAQNIVSHYTSKHIARQPKRYCLYCNSPIYKTENKFCNSSCAATYNNIARDYTVFKPGPKPKPKIDNKVPNASEKKYKNVSENKRIRKRNRSKQGKLKECIICQKSFIGCGKSCSPECVSKVLSISMKNRIYNGYNPNINRGRGKRSWMETSFEEWLLSNNVTDFLIEEPFRRLDMTKTYFADFYFPRKKLIIELDGTQHKKRVEYDKERDQYISSVYDLLIVRISYVEYKKKTRLEEIKALLGICDGAGDRI